MKCNNSKPSTNTPSLCTATLEMCCGCDLGVLLQIISGKLWNYFFKMKALGLEPERKCEVVYKMLRLENMKSRQIDVHCHLCKCFLVRFQLKLSLLNIFLISQWTKASLIILHLTCSSITGRANPVEVNWNLGTSAAWVRCTLCMFASADWITVKSLSRPMRFEKSFLRRFHKRSPPIQPSTRARFERPRTWTWRLLQLTACSLKTCLLSCETYFSGTANAF